MQLHSWLRFAIVAILVASVPIHGDTEKNSTPCFPVGELGAKWSFPSDHLPISIWIDGIGITSWNILDPGCMRWILDNTQGLKESSLVTDHRPVKEGAALTIREAHVLDQLDTMIHCPNPQSVLALQEVGAATYAALKERLPSYMHIIRSNKGPLVHEDILIYDSRRLRHDGHVAHNYSGKGNTWLLVKLKDKESKQRYHVIVSHVPGGPDAEGYLRELAEASLSRFDVKAHTLIVGDQNRSPDYFLKQLDAVAREKKMRQPFIEIPVTYPTHVNTLCEASWIDNIFFASPATALPHVQVAEPSKQAQAAADLMWKRFPLQDKLTQTRQTLGEVPALFDRLVDKWRYQYLVTEGRFDLGKLLEAVVCAAQAHTKIAHSLQVCDAVWEEGQIRQASVLIAALLHDTNLSYEELVAQFGERVALTVQAVTKPADQHMILDAQIVKLAKQLATIRQATPDHNECKRLLDTLHSANPGLEHALQEALLKE